MAGTSATKEIDFASLRTIGEVAEGLELPQHVLRFWETRFKEIDPVKRAGGRRFYRETDIELVAAIRHLLYHEGYTIKGVQRILKENGVDAVIEDVRRRLAEEMASALPPCREATLDAADEAPAEDMSQAAFDLPIRDETETSTETLALSEDSGESAEPATGVVLAAEVEPPVAIEPVVVIRRLDESDVRVLGDALAEIEECKRLLQLTRR